eukprot:Skav200033  [mRNA]  locus=scaffold225:321376:331996:- [translate_table: standard]
MASNLLHCSCTKRASWAYSTLPFVLLRDLSRPSGSIRSSSKTFRPLSMTGLPWQSFRMPLSSSTPATRLKICRRSAALLVSVSRMSQASTASRSATEEAPFSAPTFPVGEYRSKVFCSSALSCRSKAHQVRVSEPV